MIDFNNKGISLVALVVTVIVLLILAGFSFTFVLGENGIITKAKNAKEQTEIAQAEETIKLKIAEVQIDKNGDATVDDINSALEDNSDLHLSSTYESIIYKNKYIFDLDSTTLNITNGRTYNQENPNLEKRSMPAVFDNFNRDEE